MLIVTMVVPRVPARRLMIRYLLRLSLLWLLDCTTLLLLLSVVSIEGLLLLLLLLGLGRRNRGGEG